MVEVRTPIFPLPRHHSPCKPPSSLPSPSRLGSCHAYDKGRVFQVPPDMDNPPFSPSTRIRFASYPLIATRPTPRPSPSLGHDDPYPFKRSLFGGGDYRVPRDLLRTGLFGLGPSVRNFSSLLSDTLSDTMLRFHRILLNQVRPCCVDLRITSRNKGNICGTRRKTSVRAHPLTGMKLRSH